MILWQVPPAALGWEVLLEAGMMFAVCSSWAGTTQQSQSQEQGGSSSHLDGHWEPACWDKAGLQQYFQ